MLQQFETGQKTLRTQQDISDLEQVGFGLRLQNDQYINQLQDIGQRQRLDDQLSFKKQLAQTVFQDQQDILQNEIAFNRMMDADDREFAEELAQMDINYAMQVADNAAKSAATRQIATGIGGTITGGLQTAKAMGIFDSNSDASTGASGQAVAVSQRPLPLEPLG